MFNSFFSQISFSKKLYKYLPLSSLYNKKNKKKTYFFSQFFKINIYINTPHSHQCRIKITRSPLCITLNLLLNLTVVINEHVDECNS